MSYSGSVEWLCESGHHLAFDCWSPDPKECHCGAPLAYRHSIDTTNGSNDDEPWSLPAPKKEIGFDDRWNKDHHGNEYAVKIMRYEPLSEWKPVVP